MPSQEETSQKDVKAGETKKLPGNATLRKLACSVVWVMSFLVFYEFLCDHFALSLFAMLISIPRVLSDKSFSKLRLHWDWCADVQLP
jgi:hypothetical protein